MSLDMFLTFVFQILALSITNGHHNQSPSMKVLYNMYTPYFINYPYNVVLPYCR